VLFLLEVILKVSFLLFPLELALRSFWRGGVACGFFGFSPPPPPPQEFTFGALFLFSGSLRFLQSLLPPLSIIDAAV